MSPAAVPWSLDEPGRRVRTAASRHPPRTRPRCARSRRSRGSRRVSGEPVVRGRLGAPALPGRGARAVHPVGDRSGPGRRRGLGGCPPGARAAVAGLPADLGTPPPPSTLATPRVSATSARCRSRSRSFVLARCRVAACWWSPARCSTASSGPATWSAPCASATTPRPCGPPGSGWRCPSRRSRRAFPACPRAYRSNPGSAPTVKQHLAAIRMLGDWLVVSQVLPVNPAAAVRGSKHVVTKGATPVLSPAMASRWTGGPHRPRPVRSVRRDPHAGRNPDPRAGLRRPALQPLPATATARQSPRRTQRGAGAVCLAQERRAGNRGPSLSLETSGAARCRTCAPHERITTRTGNRFALDDNRGTGRNRRLNKEAKER